MSKEFLLLFLLLLLFSSPLCSLPVSVGEDQQAEAVAAVLEPLAFVHVTVGVLLSTPTAALPFKPLPAILSVIKIACQHKFHKVECDLERKLTRCSDAAIGEGSGAPSVPSG